MLHQESSPSSPRVPAPPESQALPSERKREILVVDDHPDVRALLVAYLAREGYAIAEAADGEGALASIRGHRPDLVLLDVGLPDMNGLVVLGRIRRDDPTLGVIMMSGFDDEILVRSALDLGALDFLQKPLILEHLDRAVRAALAAH